jgi:hypothetical protein
MDIVINIDPSTCISLAKYLTIMCCAGAVVLATAGWR